MKVQIRVCTNGQEIDDAKRKNDFYQKQREANAKLTPKKKMLVPDNVEVPEPEIINSDLLIDEKDIISARINEIGNISIECFGREKQIVYSDEVWEKLEKRFNV